MHIGMIYFFFTSLSTNATLSLYMSLEGGYRPSIRGSQILSKAVPGVTGLHITPRLLQGLPPSPWAPLISPHICPFLSHDELFHYQSCGSRLFWMDPNFKKENNLIQIWPTKVWFGSCFRISNQIEIHSLVFIDKNHNKVVSIYIRLISDVDPDPRSVDPDPE